MRKEILECLKGYSLRPWSKIIFILIQWPLAWATYDPLPVKDISVSYGTVCAVLDQNAGTCWGANSNGELGLGLSALTVGNTADTMGPHLPMINLGYNESPKMIVPGGSFTCALVSSKQVKCWGHNSYGQLGRGNSDDNIGTDLQDMGDHLPKVDLGNVNVTDITCGDAHVCVLTDTQKIKCWGSNIAGQLGLGKFNDTVGFSLEDLGEKLPYVNLGNQLTTVFKVVAGGLHTCALVKSAISSHGNETFVQGVKCWGDNSDGQLGQGDNRNRGFLPQDMGKFLPLINLGRNVTVVELAAGLFHNCILADNGKVKCWGANEGGQLGYEDTHPRGLLSADMGDHLPYINLGSNFFVKKITAGYSHNCALSKAGNLKCWGSNGMGELGQGDGKSRGDLPDTMGDLLLSVNLGLNALPTDVSAGGFTTCASFGNQLLAKCFGLNWWGQVGICSQAVYIGKKHSQMGNALIYVGKCNYKSNKKIKIHHKNAKIREENPILEKFRKKKEMIENSLN